MSYTEDQVLEELRKNGIGTMEDLARKIAEQSDAKAAFAEARGLSPQVDADYLWSGKNYSLWHPE